MVVYRRVNARVYFLSLNILYFIPAAGEGKATVSKFFPSLPSLSASHVRTIELIPSHPRRRSGVIVLCDAATLSLTMERATLPLLSSSILSQLDAKRILILLLFLMPSKKQFKNSDRGRKYFRPPFIDLLMNELVFFSPAFEELKIYIKHATDDAGI